MTLLVLLLLLPQPTTGATGGREGLGGYRSTASALNVWRQHRCEHGHADTVRMCRLCTVGHVFGGVLVVVPLLAFLALLTPLGCSACWVHCAAEHKASPVLLQSFSPDLSGLPGIAAPTAIELHHVLCWLHMRHPLCCCRGRLRCSHSYQGCVTCCVDCGAAHTTCAGWLQGPSSGNFMSAWCRISHSYGVFTFCVDCSAKLLRPHRILSISCVMVAAAGAYLWISLVYQVSKHSQQKRPSCVPMHGCCRHTTSA
jgi:hypothetical protein